MNIIEYQINNMFCQICSFYESDSTMIEYSCGHAFHRRCILPNEMSLIAPRCKICIDGYYNNDDNNDDNTCNHCSAPRYRNRQRSYSDSEFSDIWDEINEYRDISATCVGFMGILSLIVIVLLVRS